MNYKMGRLPRFPTDRRIREKIYRGRNDRVRVLDVFSWLPAKEISIEELEQIFIGHFKGTYEGEYRVLLEMPESERKIIFL